MIKVIVTGSCAEGKTTLSILISETLRQAGFKVENTDIDAEHHVLEEMQCQRINALVSRYADVPIVVETVQLFCKPFEKITIEETGDDA